MKVNLIRHAKIKTPSNIVQGLDDPIVVDKETLREAAQAKASIENAKKVYCSNLPRAKQTLALLLPDTSAVVYTDMLNEYVRPSRFIGGPRQELTHFWKQHDRERYNLDWQQEPQIVIDLLRKFSWRPLEVKEFSV